MPEFTAVLNSDNLFDIFIDGEQLYFGLNPNELTEFAEAFIQSNLPEEES
jgi:hypothetical protein